MDNSKLTCEDDDIYNTDILIRLFALTKGPLLERRKEIRKSFVTASLSMYRPGSEFEVKDLSRSIKRITMCDLSNEDIIAILDRDDTVQHIDGLKYRLKKKIDLPEFSSLTQPVWEEFLNILKKRYVDYDPYIDKDARNIFDSVLLRLLARFSVSSNILTTNQIEFLPINDFKLIIEGYVKQPFLSEGLSKKYADIIFSFLESRSPHLSDFIFDSYSKLINLDLLSREQEIQPINFLEDIKFLLVDTTFLTALMCRTDPRHPLVSAVAKQCTNSNIPLYYTSRTKQEMLGFVNGSKWEMRNLYQPVCNIKSFSQPKVQEIIKSQFVLDFIRQRQIKNISWEEYISTIVLWEEIINDKNRVVPTPESFDDNVEDDVFHYAMRVLPVLDNIKYEERLRNNPNYKPVLRGNDQFEHDAFCIGVIAENRRLSKIIDGRNHIGPWFLTFDNLLSLLSVAYTRNGHDFGFVIQPRTLLNYLLIFSKIQIGEEDKEAIAEAILKFTVQVPEPKLTLEEYADLVTYKMGLGEDDIDIIREIFLAHPLRAELEKEIRLDHGKEAGDCVLAIVANQNFIEAIIGERKTNEKYKNVLQRLHIVSEQCNKEKAARETLERIIEQNSSSTINTEKLHMGDIYKSNQTLSQGPNANIQTRDINFNQIWNKVSDKIDLSELARELAVLKVTAKDRLTESEHYVSIGEIALAEDSARKGDGVKTLEHLAKIGKWGLDIAKEIGTKIAAEMIIRAMGLQTTA